MSVGTEGVGEDAIAGWGGGGKLGTTQPIIEKVAIAVRAIALIPSINQCPLVISNFL
jgi:hypothetical protein